MLEDWRAEKWLGTRPLFRGWRRRLFASLTVLLAGFAWAVVYVAVLADRLPWYWNLGVGLATVAAVPAALLAIWLSWVLGVRRRVREWVYAPFDP